MVSISSLFYPAVWLGASGGAPLAATLLPLASAFGYVAAVLLVKRASAHGVGLWRTAFVSNLAMGLCFAPLWLLGGAELDAALWWQPVMCAGLFFAGQVFTFSALAGDVSLATPVLGLKIVFVAAASSWLLEETVRPAWWLAAALATAAVVLLQSGPRGVPATAGGKATGAQAPGRTVVFAALAALAFALSDVLVQRFAAQWGAGRLLPLMFGLVAVLSFGLVPVFQAPLRSLRPAAWRWLAPGALLLALQAAGMAYTLGTHGRATAANILYSTRGLWSVLAVGLLGAWLGTADERALPRGVFRRRLIGSGLMLAAVVLVLG
jgi:drug/metabolite transporter (DMT)-like permease